MRRWTTRIELEHQIITLRQQGLSRRAIARALSVSRNTVHKLLLGHQEARQKEHSALAPAPARAPRPTKVDPYQNQVAELLTSYPEITAQRVFEELRGGGYDGGYTQVKEHVAKVRPRQPPTPSLPTPSYGPGEMAESDWSPYTIDFLDGQRRLVQAFSYVLVWSRRKCLFFYESCDVHALMDGHSQSFARLGGAAKSCKYDSQKPVVLCWEGAQPIYNPRFLAYATHYQFQPRAVRIGHPNDKPRVERTFWELEQSFFNGRRFRDLADLRAQLALWLDQTCDQRRRTAQTPSALETFVQEQPQLVPLPARPYDTARVVYRVCGIDGFVSFEGNRYAVPYDYVTDLLPVRITQSEVFIYAADLKLVAHHELAPRGAGRTSDPAQFHKPAVRRSMDLDQLKRLFAELGEPGALFFADLVHAQSRQAGYHARQILLLRERYSSKDLCAALSHARGFGAFQAQAIERILVVRATPRRLAEYVAEQTALKLDEAPQPPDSYLRDLDEYDQLPLTPTAKEHS